MYGPLWGTDRSPYNPTLYFMLRNLKILDVSRVLAGPLCAQTLASLGARVIKVEPPSGDLTRRWKGSEGGVEAYFGAVNRGKESVCLDLKGGEGRVRLRSLLREVRSGEEATS